MPAPLDLDAVGQEDADVWWECSVAQSPLIRLRAVHKMRLVLDRLERNAVVVARSRGESWEHIAEALRVSRQAAHRRFHDLVDDSK